MSEPKPILETIHDQFETFPRTEVTDHTAIDAIAITEAGGGYRVTTYPRGYLSAADGLAIDVTV